MARIIGIDLGTTNTAVAVLEGGRPRTLEDERGYKVLPSVVSAKGEGRFVVGQAAASLILTRPDRTVYATKRLIGRRYDSPEVQRVKERVHYLVREGPDGGVQLQVGDAWMTPQEVAAVVLQVARGIAEKSLGETVEEAVITVPAHFNHAQRAATLEAAQLAGLRCERLLNEPTAAALAYGHRKNIDRTLVVFDLGGGTFDVSVLRLRDGIYEILATSGDTFLGGEDFDYRVVDVLADGFAAKNGGLDLRKDKGSLQRLKDAAERAKCELSFSDRANVVVPHAAPGKNLETVLTRRQIEEATGDLVDRCVAIAREAVQSAGVPLGEVDEVILVGGMTRMPRVREAVSALFGREASRTVHPEEAVAVGAAVHASNLEDVDGPRPVLLDVAPFDLGIDAVGGHFSVIIAKNARVPCSESKVFATARDNQESVKVTVRQGESRTAADNEFLGEFVFDGLPAAPKLQTKVSVTFRIDQNGMLHVSASDPATGARRNITIRNYAEHARSPEIAAVVEGGGAAGSAASAKLAEALGPPREATAAAPHKGDKKPGLLDRLLGRKKPAKTKVAASVAAPVEAAPVDAEAIEPEPVHAEAMEAEPVEAEAMEAEPGSDDLGPSPMIRLPAPSFLSEEEPIAADGLVELDEVLPLAPIEEDDLYGVGDGAGFGLGGASLGAGARGGDLFSDPVPADHGSLDADDLFGEALGDEEEDEDLPTDHGARSPVLAAPARPVAPPAHPVTPPARPVTPPASDFDDDTFSLPDDLSSLFDEAVASVASDVPEDVDDSPTPSPQPGPVLHRAPPGPAAIAFDDGAAEDLGALLFGDDAGGPLLSGDAAADDGGVDFALPDEPVGFALAEPVDEPTGFAFAEPEADEPTGFALPEEDAFVVPSDLAEPAPQGRRVDEPAPQGRRVDEPAPQGRHLDDEDLEAFAMPDDDPDVTRPLVKKAKKPARIRLQYRDQAEFAAEYRLHLRDNAQFIRTDKPLPVGRACVFEIGAPGLAEPLVFDAVVDAVSDGRNGAEAGMRVAWRLDTSTRQRLERAVAGG